MVHFSFLNVVPLGWSCNMTKANVGQWLLHIPIEAVDDARWNPHEFTYKRLIGEYLTRQVTEIDLFEPHILNKDQDIEKVHKINLKSFFNLVKANTRCMELRLHTKKKIPQAVFADLRRELHRKCKLIVHPDWSLHDRRINLIPTNVQIVCGRGLDYFQYRDYVFYEYTNPMTGDEYEEPIERVEVDERRPTMKCNLDVLRKGTSKRDLDFNPENPTPFSPYEADDSHSRSWPVLDGLQVSRADDARIGEDGREDRLEESNGEEDVGELRTRPRHQRYLDEVVKAHKKKGKAEFKDM
uniref:MIT_C domain-containing protein n=1 Tax=Steinernema glaseri TaxID=37863 RepID=A0A1I7ZX59_9BILA